jgi:hypothetical protein
MKRLACLVLWCSALLGFAASADPVVVNPNFGAVAVSCGLNYAYQNTPTNCASPAQDFNADPNFGWTLTSTGTGLTKPSTNFNPPSFAGMPFTQAVFLQNNASSATQSVTGFAAGNHVLSFYIGSRTGNGGNQTVQALIDGNVVGTWPLATSTPFTMQSATFSVSSSGSHTLQFKGLATGDQTAFVSGVSITPVRIVPVSPAVTLALVALLALGGCLAWRTRRRPGAAV